MNILWHRAKLSDYLIETLKLDNHITTDGSQSCFLALMIFAECFDIGKYYIRNLCSVKLIRDLDREDGDFESLY
jgi:hypothetical protein